MKRKTKKGSIKWQELQDIKGDE